MNYKKIIRDAWILTQNDKKLIQWYGFMPALLTTLVGILYVVYQFFAFKTSYLFTSDGSNDGILFTLIDKIFSFVKLNSSVGIFFAVAATVICLFYLFLPTICQGALIQLVARKRNGQDVSMVDGVKYGLFSFLPLFEYHAIIKSFSLVALLIEASFVVRNLGMGVFKFLLIPFIIILVIGFILTLLFTYTEYFIVIDKGRVIKSIGRSCKLVITHWQHTLLMVILMLFITLRIIVNILLVLLIPALILLPAAYIATLTAAKIALILGGLVGLVGLYFAAYFGGVLTVFTTSVWTFTFLELSSIEEKSARETEKSLSARDIVSTEISPEATV